MAISGIQTINIGIQNESVGSDSLYVAFNKTANNFANLFACASPYNTFTGNGISIDANSSTGTLDFTNTGVTNLNAGTGIVLSSSNGNVTISSTGGGGGNGGGTVTSVGVSSSTLNVSTTSLGNIVSAGNIIVNLSNVAGVSGTYVYPTVSVDQYGRITSIASASSVGTVTSVAISGGAGIQVANSPITSSGTIQITNTGVTRISAGSGITVSGSNAEVTISASPVSAVTSVGLTSTSLSVSGSPITSAGIMTVELPTNITVTGNVISGNVRTTGSLLSNSATSGVGYASGAGSTVTQGTSRTTGVTINSISGAITLFSAAGTSSYTTFTVTNSTVAATDVVIVNQKSGTDIYQAFVSNVAAGSFKLTFSDVSGTTTEQPVFNFAVIKAVAA